MCGSISNGFVSGLLDQNLWREAWHLGARESWHAHWNSHHERCADFLPNIYTYQRNTMFTDNLRPSPKADARKYLSIQNLNPHLHC